MISPEVFTQDRGRGERRRVGQDAGRDISARQRRKSRTATAAKKIAKPATTTVAMIPSHWTATTTAMTARIDAMSAGPRRPTVIRKRPTRSSIDGRLAPHTRTWLLIVFPMCTVGLSLVHPLWMRTTIDIDDGVLREVQRLTGARTKREAVDVALRDLVARYRRVGVLKLRGKVRWEGDLSSRAGRT